MKILDIFKTKKPREKPAKKEVKPVEGVKEDKSSSSPFAAARVVKEDKSSLTPFAAARVLNEIKEQVTIPRKERKALVTEAYKILKNPHITEKATDLAVKNQYVFKVWSKTNKIEIKKSIEDLYGVDVMDVKIIKVPRKRKRLGRISGWQKAYKKAIVKIKEGQKIEVLSR